MKRAASRPIQDFAIGIYDGPHATPKEASEGPIFLGIKNLTDDGRLDLSDIRHISEYDFPKWTRRVTPQPNDIVFTYEATLHRYALIPEGFRGCLGRRLALIRPDHTQVDANFLLYYFLSHNWRKVVEGFVKPGATVDRIPLEEFPRFPVALPDLQTQHKIACLLSAYDELIENNQRRIALLEEAARLLYREWFVRLRFPGHEHTRIVDGVPQGWEKKQLGAVITLNYGKALREPDRVDGPVPVYGSSGILARHNQPLIRGPGIILGRKGNVGATFWSESDFWPIDTVYYVDSEQCTRYLFHYLQHQTFLNSDVAVPGLNRNYAHSLQILIPDQTLIKAFEEAVGPLYQQVSTIQRINEKLKLARDLLLPRLMRGEIAV